MITMFFIGFLLGVVGYGLYISGRFSFRVDQGHLAVLTSFGAALHGEGNKLTTFGPGLHFKWPWQKAHCVSMMEQSVDLSGEKAGKTAMTDDGTILRLDSILRFHPREEQLYQYLFDLRDANDHIVSLFTCLLRNEIANYGTVASDGRPRPVEEVEGGSYAMLRRERRELSRRIEEFSSKVIGERYGVQFSAMDLTDILPPEELAQALNAVINAQEDADTQYANAEAECQQRVVAAERGVEVAKSRALAVETEINTLAGFLDELHRQGTLLLYVGRRRTEVLSQSRSLFLRSAS
jgi:regulator of protease activity HflC (stomatin/prohibitin superfamily)